MGGQGSDEENLKARSVAEEPGIHVRNLSFQYGKKKVLTNTDLDATPGTCVGITGTNGSGKSTLLSIMAGIRKPKTGELFCYGKDLLREKSRIPEMTAYVPQENPLIEELSAADNLRLWCGIKDPGLLQSVQMLHLQPYLRQKVSGLSGGTRRRLAIACAIAGGQPVLLMDEPTASLDIYQKIIIQNYIREFTSIGGIVIMSTHDIAEIKYCTKLYYIENGSVTPAQAEEVIERMMYG